MTQPRSGLERRELSIVTHCLKLFLYPLSKIQISIPAELGYLESFDASQHRQLLYWPVEVKSE